MVSTVLSSVPAVRIVRVLSLPFQTEKSKIAAGSWKGCQRATIEGQFPVPTGSVRG